MNTTAFRPAVLTVVVLAWVTLVLVAISLGSRAAEAQGEGAIVSINEGSCFIGGLGPTLPISGGTDDRQAVLTPSGNLKITCRWPPFPEAVWPSETVILTGFDCGTPFGTTTDSRLVYTTSGRLTLTCYVHPNG